MLRTLHVVCSCSLAWLLAGSAPAQGGDVVKSAPPPQPTTVVAAVDFAGFTDAGDVRLHINRDAVDNLPSAEHVALRLAISPIESITLDLQRFEVIAPDARLVRATADESTSLARPTIAFLRGQVAGEPLSHAYFAVSQSDDHLSGLGMITRNDGRRISIGVDRTGLAPALVLRHSVGDLPPFDDLCAMIAPDDGGVAGGPPEGQPDDAAAGPRVLNLAIDSDLQYWQLFNNDAAALDYVAMVLGAISDIYIRDLNMRIALRFARIWPAGGEPFSASNLGGFRTHWLDNEDMTGLNLVHMFSGRRDLSYGGVAYLTNACSGSAFGIDGFMLGGFPRPFGQPHLGNWDVQVAAHEMGHNLGTPHTHDYKPPVDTCAQGTDERGTIMSYCHTRPGGLLNTDIRMHAATQDIIAADNPHGPKSCLWNDCNGNLINDATDIAEGDSADVNADGIPDECQDCNSNGVLDPVEIASAAAADVNGNGVPDACENDCNANGIPDRWECAQGLAADLDGDRVPDTCQPDCDGNGVPDFLDIANGTHTDLDRNSRPDLCDDCNANGTTDWLDVDREFNVFIGQSPDQVGGDPVSPLREYLAASGVLVQPVTATGATDVRDVVFGPDGQAYVASYSNHRVLKVDVDANTSSIFVQGGGAAGNTNPSALAFGPDGHLYVASQTGDAVLRYNGETGTLIGTFVAVGSGGLDEPRDMAFGPDGHLYVLTTVGKVFKYNGTTGAFISSLISAGAVTQARGLCFLPNGDLLISSSNADKIQRFSSTGVDLGKWNDNYPLSEPWGVTRGPNGNIYAAALNNPVRVIEYDFNTGRYLRSYIRGDDDLIGPTAIAFRPASSNDANGNLLPDECDNTCPIDFFPPPTGSGEVDVDELVGVILTWGACADCPSDIAPPGGNGAVDVDDLIAVILNWGPCD